MSTDIRLDDPSQQNEKISALIERAKAFLGQGRYADAIARLEPVLKLQPENIEALYITAVAQRYLEHHDDALASQARIKKIDPTYARAYQ
ncbi:MAG: tetratricopeptide repeat protein, partial [Alphaproteobacteria bacterium]|nr:tetratricopeptide repeat protein [Alphaproteobacteria bacterium]